MNILLAEYEIRMRKKIIVYLGMKYANDWFSTFSKLFCKEFLEGRFDIQYAQAVRKCSKTAYPVYKELNGREIKGHSYCIAFQSHETRKITILTTHYRPFDFFEEFGFYFGDVKNVISGHFHRESLFIEAKEKLKKLYNVTIDRKEHFDKVYKPWIFRPLSWGVLDSREFSYNMDKAISQSYFRGAFNEARHCLRYLNNCSSFKIHLGMALGQERLREKEYYSELLNYKIALSVPGAGDVCNRDIECFAIGMPVLRPAFKSELAFEIPRDAYIPVDYEPIDDHRGGKKFWHPKSPSN